ncbi:hypothetical protein EV182_006596 [Spiromyces aspiralis]|uniref:Uncharacterized protein n=1 Tax=Spiromyces aspiralis TaxID=68401 RepID=A0ACC1HPH2_9FUNG|nr:hypothetical protein EV182_006596 [Spiromyces aspiralis]
MVIMILVGILRHQLSILMSGGLPKVEVKEIRQGKALVRAQLLLENKSHIPASAIEARKRYFCQAFEDGEYLKDKDQQGQGPVNPMMDPKVMDTMMEGMKSQMMGMVPQTLIMGWIQFFFTGFILIRLPFPLGARFKSMLQAGIMTPNMDVSWVSSLSWYFLNLFGLRGVFSLILGSENSADGMRDMQAMSTMGIPTQQPGQPQDFNKLFINMKEHLSIMNYEYGLTSIGQRVLTKYAD